MVLRIAESLDEHNLRGFPRRMLKKIRLLTPPNPGAPRRALSQARPQGATKDGCSKLARLRCPLMARIESPTARVQRGSSETARCASSRGTHWAIPPLLADFFSILLDLAQSHWPISLAGLVEFFHMPTEGWAEFGGEDCFSVGRDVLLDLLDRFCQLFDQPLA